MSVAVLPARGGWRRPDFWSLVDVGSLDDCWPWKGKFYGKSPYGFWSVTKAKYDHDGKRIGRTVINTAAHREAFKLARGYYPKHGCACHSCDNPPCCNPLHLFDSDRAGNRKDCVAKRRHSRGANHGRAKLTAKDVTFIRDFLAEGCSVRYLAAEFQVSQSLIEKIRTREIWKEVV